MPPKTPNINQIFNMLHNQPILNMSQSFQITPLGYEMYIFLIADYDPDNFTFLPGIVSGVDMNGIMWSIHISHKIRLLDGVEVGANDKRGWCFKMNAPIAKVSERRCFSCNLTFWKPYCSNVDELGQRYCDECYKKKKWGILAGLF
jgi:hypothetical protein